MTDPQPPAEPAAALEPPEPPAAPSPADPRRIAPAASVHLALAIVAVLAGGALFVSGFALGALKATTPGTPVDEAAAFQPFWDAYRSITQDYAGGPVDHKELIDGAIRGMIGALDDPFSAYLSPEEYRQSLQGLSGQFEGIGAQVETRRVSGDGACAAIGDGCAFIVVEPTPDAPAAKAGLLAEDRIVAIDGATVDGLTSDQALAKVRGPKGTTVILSIIRAGGAPFDLPIVRAVIIQPEVTARTLADGSVGYVRLRGFSDRAAGQFSQAVAADVAAGRQKLIVDLRGNPGGYVLDAQQVISQFVAGRHDILPGGRGRDAGAHDGSGRRVGHGSGDPGRRPHRRRQCLGERDRGRRAPGPRPGQARRDEVVWQGHGPGLAAARRRQRRISADRRQMADPERALDPQGGAHTRRRRRSGRCGGRLRSDARPGARSPRGGDTGSRGLARAA